MDRSLELDVLRSSIVFYAQELRTSLPKAGIRILYELCRRKYADKFTIGRDQCYELFRSNGLCLRRRKRPRTTNSNHHYHIYEDLLNTTPKLHPARFGELCVTDITYVATSSGRAYLSLVTDAASRLIVGWCLHPTLERQGPMKALSMAIDFYRKYNVELSQLIHHSDRGVQYLSIRYTERLEELDDLPTDVLVGWDPQLPDEEAAIAVAKLLGLLVARYPVRVEVTDAMRPLAIVCAQLVADGVAKVAETLDEFRGRYRYNLLDEHLRRFAAQVPQLWQWDDHEVVNNWSPGKDLRADPRQGQRARQTREGTSDDQGTQPVHHFAPHG